MQPNPKTMDISPTPPNCRHPMMSGDARLMLDRGRAIAAIVQSGHESQFAAQIPIAEWRLEVAVRQWWRPQATVHVLVPEECRSNDAILRHFRPLRNRDREFLARCDWNDVAPSPNPGLLAYHVARGLSAISIPTTVKEGVRHNFYRHFFLEFTDPEWKWPLRYHNDPGITISQERELVEQLRRSL